MKAERDGELYSRRELFGDFNYYYIRRVAFQAAASLRTLEVLTNTAPSVSKLDLISSTQVSSHRSRE
jgi:hypothetical protein